MHSLLNQLLADKANDSQDGVTFNFRAPTYSAEAGGFHPVEISINSQGVLQYVTDFSFAGIPPYAELGVELDWSFEYGTFRLFKSEFKLVDGQGLFRLYTQNFFAYYEMSVYEVTEAWAGRGRGGRAGGLFDLVFVRALCRTAGD